MDFFKKSALILLFSACVVNCQFQFAWMNSEQRDKFVKPSQIITENCINITKQVI